jgi:dienelactone hydrolase
MRIAFLLLVLIGFPGFAGEGIPWNLKELSQPPRSFPADDFESSPGMRPLFFEGRDWKGKPTRVFAWYGVPMDTRGKVPAMVLVHGGGGTAFSSWVKLWNDRGYAAIAMDTCGAVPKGKYGAWERHDSGGPPGWGGLDQIDQPVEDQWSYHAVADVILAHSLIRSFPEVDATRIGITGVSWGGYLTCIAAGVDDRFLFAAPVYGCGFLGENSAWVPALERMDDAKAQRWLDLWDPSVYLPAAKMPFLWVNGTTDFAYPMDSWQKSYRLPKKERTLCLRVNMPHGHGPAGEGPEEIHAFANSFCKDGLPLVRIAKQWTHGSSLYARVEGKRSIKRAELNYTTDLGEWQKRKWTIAPARFDSKEKVASASIPPDATVFYLNVFDDREHAVSTEHLEKKR